MNINVTQSKRCWCEASAPCRFQHFTSRVLFCYRKWTEHKSFAATDKTWSIAVLHIVPTGGKGKIHKMKKRVPVNKKSPSKSWTHKLRRNRFAVKRKRHFLFFRTSHTRTAQRSSTSSYGGREWRRRTKRDGWQLRASEECVDEKELQNSNNNNRGMTPKCKWTWMLHPTPLGVVIADSQCRRKLLWESR